MAHAPNLTGRTFGRLTVFMRQPAPPNAVPRTSRHAMWICDCSCNGDLSITVRADHLLSGHTKSCGCLLQEWRKDAKK